MPEDNLTGVIYVGCEYRAYLIVETQDMCFVESQETCRVEMQDMWCAESGFRRPSLYFLVSWL